MLAPPRLYYARPMRLIYSLLLIVLIAAGGVSIYMALFEDQFIYFPDSELQQTPAAVGLAFENHQFSTTDGVRLYGWYIAHPSARFTVLHLHGNAGNISHRLSLYRRWHQLGLAVFAFDYRGYGNSEGKPGEEGLYEDGRAAWRFLIDKLAVKPAYVIISGRSLGAAVAAKLATEKQAAGVVLETPFTSIPDMAAYHYPWLPLRFLARSHFDTQAMVGDIDAPLLLISATNDAIAPPAMAGRIFAAASEPKHHVTLSGAHNSFDRLSERQYLNSWQSWLATLGR